MERKFTERIVELWAKKKRIVYFIILLLFLAGLALFIYKTCVYPASREPFVTFENKADQIPSEKLKEGDIWKQTFQASTDTISGVSVQMATYQKVNQGNLLVTVKNMDTGDLVYNENILMNQIIDNQFMKFLFAEPVSDIKGDTFEISVTVLLASEDTSLSVWLSEGDSYTEGTSELNGSILNGDASFQIYSGDSSYINLIFIISSIILLLGLCLIYYLLFIRKQKISTVFVIVAAFLGLGYTFLMPPGSIPDEEAHIETAYRYSNQMMFLGYQTEDGDMLMRQEDMEILSKLPHDPSPTTYRFVAENFFKTCGNNTLVEKGGRDVDTSKFVYLPTSIGITIGRLMNLGFIPVLYLGRLLNYVFYIALIYFAIKIMPIAKILLFTIALLPMSIHQAASLSSDGVIMALAFFLIGYIVKMAYGEEQIKILDIILICIAGGWLTLCKDGAYAPLVFLILLIPSHQFISKKYHVLSKAIVSCFILFLFIVNTILPMVFTSGGGENIIPWSGTPGYTLGWALHNPFGFIRILIATFLDYTGDFYIQSMIGGSLGWLRIQIPDFIGIAFIILLLISGLKKDTERQLIKTSHKLWIFILVIGSVLAIEIGMFISWTPMGSLTISGVQGRYLLPILPALLLIVRNSNLTLKRDVSQYIIIAICSLNLIEMGLAFRAIVG